jgi:hypothetical protein
VQQGRQQQHAQQQQQQPPPPPQQQQQHRASCCGLFVQPLLAGQYCHPTLFYLNALWHDSTAFSVEGFVP